MTNKDKMEIAANILISIMSNSSLKTMERFDQAPQVLEKIYNKIDELDKNTKQIDNPDIPDIVVV